MPPQPTRVAFHDEVTPADTATVTGRISGENHPFVEHFKFVKQFEDENTVARQTMPSPAQTRFVLTGNAAATRMTSSTRTTTS